MTEERNKNTQVFVDGPDGAQRRLEQLGYKQELKRGLSAPENTILGLSNASPIMAAFVYSIVIFTTVGTATGASLIVQGINVIFIGLILAELGSIYPVSGGMYSLIQYTLPGPLMFLGAATFMLQSFIYPPGVAMGIVEYLQALFPSLPNGELATSITAAIVLTCALLLGLNSIVTNSRVAIGLLVLQMAVIAVFVYVCVTNIQQPVGEFIFDPKVLNEEGTGLEPVHWTAVLTGVGILCASIDGYPASLGFSEETKGSCRGIGKAVLATAIIMAIITVTIMLSGALAAPDLVAFIKNDTPLIYVFETYAGAKAVTIINLGVIIASFACLTTLMNYMARVLYTGARDRLWPDKMNSIMSKISGKTAVPWVCLLMIFIVDLVLVFASDIVSVITFGALLAAVVYLLVAIGSIFSRQKNKDITRPFKMPLYPLPPILVSAILIVAIVNQEITDIVIVSVILALALIYYFSFYRPRKLREEKEKK